MKEYRFEYSREIGGVESQVYKVNADSWKEALRRYESDTKIGHPLFTAYESGEKVYDWRAYSEMRRRYAEYCESICYRLGKSKYEVVAGIDGECGRIYRYLDRESAVECYRFFKDKGIRVSAFG